MSPSILKGLGSLGGIGLAGGLVTMVIQMDRHERELILGGHCRPVIEQLYTPPPTARTSCFGSNPPICSTSIYQSNPYFRTMWRCQDPEDGGREVEFWRRSRDDERASE